MQYALNQQQFHELVLKKIRNEKKKDQMPGIYYSIIYNNKKFQCISIGEYEINFRHCLEKTDIHIMTLIVLLWFLICTFSFSTIMLYFHNKKTIKNFS